MSGLSVEELSALMDNILKEKGIVSTREFILSVCYLVKDRVVLIPDLWEQSHYFFIAPDSYHDNVVQKYWKSETPTLLKQLALILASTEDYSVENTETVIKTFIHDNNLGMGQIMNTLRLALVGGSFGPGVSAIISLLGMDETLKRIQKATDNISII
jgi:glutamyl-tRNA synthetase